jgi:ABC-type branched-subunit amino acid transport system substrate-binding protein
MRTVRAGRSAIAAPVVVSTALVLAACGGGSNGSVVAQAPADPPAAAPRAVAAAPAAAAPTATVPAATAAAAAPPAAKAPASASVKKATATRGMEATHPAARGLSAVGTDPTRAARFDGGQVRALDTPAQAAENEKIAAAEGGVTDIGVTKDSIHLGTINMHGVALGNVFVKQLANGIVGTLESINDRGGVLGRRLSVTDCDDGTGEVSRTKACIKKLVVVDKVFALLSVSSWGSASIHDDLKQYQLPAFGQWAYSQTEWQDPFMFPTHMSMVHEAMAGANWVRNVIHPKTYGLICLTSPEMQLACGQVQKVLDASGAKLVKKADVSISETSMSAFVLAMRAANPDHVIHYVINPATAAKFVVEAAQQGYWPPMGMSGNHLAAEVLGSIFGNWPAGRYWTNTTYKLWGPEFMATMNKYARGNAGANHHIVQAAYVGAMIFERTAKAVGPNLTRQRMMAVWGNGQVFNADASLDQRFSYRPSERAGDNWSHDMGQGREFMYKYTSSNTRANPDGSANGFEPDPNQFVIYTWK